MKVTGASLISPLMINFSLQKDKLHPFDHIKIWPASAQLICVGDCQMWIGYSTDDDSFDGPEKLEINGTAEIDSITPPFVRIQFCW